MGDQRVDWSTCSPDKIYQISESGEIIEITKEQYQAELKKEKKKIIARLENCIDNNKPFLLIVSETENLSPESLRLTASITTRDISKILSPFLLSIPYASAKTILDNLQEMVFLKMVEDFVRERVAEYTTNAMTLFALQMSTRVPRLNGRTNFEQWQIPGDLDG